MDFSLDGPQNVEYVDHVFTSPGALWSLLPLLLSSGLLAEVLFLVSNIYTCDSAALTLLQSARRLLLFVPGVPAGGRWWHVETLKCNHKIAV